jgi:hypothetical protein
LVSVATFSKTEKKQIHLERVGMASSRVAFLDWWRPQDQSRSGYRYVLQLAFVFVLYFGAGTLGLAVPFTSSNVSPIWPAAGVAVAAVLIWGIQIAPSYRIRCFPRQLPHPSSHLRIGRYWTRQCV